MATTYRRLARIIRTLPLDKDNKTKHYDFIVRGIYVYCEGFFARKNITVLWTRYFQRWLSTCCGEHEIIYRILCGIQEMSLQTNIRVSHHLMHTNTRKVCAINAWTLSDKIS